MVDDVLQGAVFPNVNTPVMGYKVSQLLNQRVTGTGLIWDQIVSMNEEVLCWGMRIGPCGMRTPAKCEVTHLHRNHAKLALASRGMATSTFAGTTIENFLRNLAERTTGDV